MNNNINYISTEELSDDGSPPCGLLCTKELLDGRCIVDRCTVCPKTPEIIEKVRLEIEKETKKKLKKRKTK
jgi:hypothetical protein